MKGHLFVAFGLIVASIFVFRLLDAIAQPGIGLAEAYVAGGFILSAYLVYFGGREILEKRKQDRQEAALNE